MTFMLDGTLKTSSSSSHSATTVTDGLNPSTYSFLCKAKDAAGNISVKMYCYWNHTENTVAVEITIIPLVAIENFDETWNSNTHETINWTTLESHGQQRDSRSDSKQLIIKNYSKMVNSSSSISGGIGSLTI